jgi:hypothetical protein
VNVKSNIARLISVPDIFAVFEDRVRRLISEGLRQYRDELQGVSNEMASKGLAQSGNHLRRRVEVLRKWMQTIADQTFDSVTRLPGQQRIHREVLGDFVQEQLRTFLAQGETDVITFDAPDAAKAEIRRQIEAIREGLDSDLREFQAGIWRPRPLERSATVIDQPIPIIEERSTVGARQVTANDAARVWGANPGFRLFLSHRAEERAQTSRVKDRLETFGITSFVAHNDIHPSREWQNEIENALATMDGLAALVTADFFSSVWTNQEIGYAVARGVPIVPVRFGELVPRGFIGHIQALASDWDHAHSGIAKILVRHAKALDAYIAALRDSTSFDVGNELAPALAGIESPSGAHVDAIISAYNGNSQLKGSFGFNGSKHAEYGPGLIFYLERWTNRKFALNSDYLIEAVH